MGFASFGKLFTSASKKSKLTSKLNKHEKKYAKSHNDLVDSVAKRNDRQTHFTQKAAQQIDNPALLRVGLEQGGQNVNHPLFKGAIDGFAHTKAMRAGLTPEKFIQPGKRDYLKAGKQVITTTPAGAQMMRSKGDLLHKQQKLDTAATKLHQTRFTNATAKHGELRNYNKHGQMTSGSLQADSPEALEALLKGIQPTSHVSKQDAKWIQTPGAQRLTPNNTPEKLAKPVAGKDKGLTPQQKTQQELADREQRIQTLDADLRNQDPDALTKAIQERDFYQTRTAGDLLTGLKNKPLDSAIVASDYGSQYLGAKFPNFKVPRSENAIPFYTDERLAQAQKNTGFSVGQQLGNGNVEKMVQSQVKVETLHHQGSNTARELTELRRQRALDVDRNMIIDTDGHKFYDPFESTKQIKKAEQQYDAVAKSQLPRPGDHLYLDDQVANFLPSSLTEGLRRPLNAWFHPPA